MTKMNKLFFPSLLLTAFVIILSSCSKKEGCTDTSALNFDPDAEKNCCCEYAETTEVGIHFHSFVGADVLNNGSTYEINGTTIRLDNARFYISNIRLVDANGNEVKAEGKYLLIDPAIEEYELGGFPSGNYTKIRFDVGIDSITNHSADPADYADGDPLGYQTPAMNWGWTFGYMFVLVHGQIDADDDGTLDAYLIYHLGTDEFLTPIEIDYALDATNSNEEATVHLTVDWNKFFDDVNLATEYHTEVTDDYPLASKLRSNIPSMITIEE